MDYKKKYEEALENLKKIRNANENNNELVDFIDYNYPELKESEDERIRKWLIKAMKYLSEESTFFAEVPKDKVISWLEKQGEQKPTDKVELKFKSGNWYLCVKDFFGKGVRFDKGNAYYCKLDGCLQEFDSGAHIDIVEELYEYFRLWTIQDAKDGDVLYLQHDGTEHIIIYKGVIKERFRTFVSAYCAYNGFVHDFCFADVSTYACITSERDEKDICPATKEQRDLLFQKMKESGYEWDMKKKELKEIEKKAMSDKE